MSAVSSKSHKQGVSTALAVIGAVLGGYVVSAYVSSLLVGLVYIALNGTNYGLREWLETIPAQFLFSLMTYGLFLAIIVFVCRRLAISWSDIKLGRPRFKDFFWALGFLPLYYATYLIVVGVATQLVPGFDINQEQRIGFDNAHGWQLILVFLSLVVVPPLVEEIITRGYLYTGLKRGFKLVPATTTTSLIFAVGHLEFGNGGPLVWVAALFTFVLSLFLIVLREKTGRLWASIFLHAMVNGLSFTFLFILGNR